MASVPQNTVSCSVNVNIKTYLSPGTCVAIVPSLSTQETIGGGLPCAVQLAWLPVSLPKSKREGGSCRKVGTRKPLVAVAVAAGGNGSNRSSALVVTKVISNNDNEVRQTKAGKHRNREREKVKIKKHLKVVGQVTSVGNKKHVIIILYLYKYVCM